MDRSPIAKFSLSVFCLTSARSHVAGVHVGHVGGGRCPPLLVVLVPADWWVSISSPRPSSAVKTSRILSKEYIWNNAIITLLYFIPSRTSLTTVYASRAVWQQQAESGSCWQLATAYSSCLTRPQLPVTSRQLERASQHNRETAKYVRAVEPGMEGWHQHLHNNPDLTLKCLYLISQDLDASIWLIQSQILMHFWQESNTFCSIVFSKLLSFPCSITSFTIPGM